MQGGSGVDYQTLFNIAMLIAGSAIGWVVRVMWSAIKDMQTSEKALTEKVAAVEILVAGTYVTRAELNSGMSEIKRKLDQIFDKLDGKADK